MRKTILFCGIAALMLQCKSMQPETPTPAPERETIDLLALGDSYTKGEGVAWEGNFPNQLADSLRLLNNNKRPALRVIAQTGWRTDQLRTAIEAAPELRDSTFSLVTLCIGVNNQYQGQSLGVYRAEFEELLKIAILRAGNRPERVLVLSIPDWAFTPFGQNSSNPAAISAKIDQFNAANKEISTTYKVQYVDVTTTSRQGLSNSALVASDGLHPSQIQYTRWIELLLPRARNVLQ